MLAAPLAAGAGRDRSRRPAGTRRRGAGPFRSTLDTTFSYDGSAGQEPSKVGRKIAFCDEESTGKDASGPLRAAIADFIARGRVEAALSPHTLAAYERD